MTAITGTRDVSAAYAPQAQQSAPQPPPQPSERAKDTVELSKAALAVLQGGDVDQDGDSR